MSQVLVNIGCGATWHSDWINLDLCPTDPQVTEWNASKGLPFGNELVDACYASHVLEHVTPHQARALLGECYRVLRYGGIVRLAVPDLEGIVREYLRTLERAEAGDRAAAAQHQWMTIELLDQLVRDRSGGEMERYLRTQAHNNSEYVIGRIGPGATTYLEPEGHSSTSSAPSRRGSISIISKIARTMRSLVPEMKGHLVNGDREALRIGRFRLSGECHQWMYDRVSLKQLLEETGFSDSRVCSAFESQISGFAMFGLDVVNGAVRKPDSLFMEAVKES